jgi:hypothetical protein
MMQQQQQQQIDPESDKDTHMYPLANDIFIPLQPCCSVSILGREHSFLHCGEFIVGHCRKLLLVSILKSLVNSDTVENCY